MSKDHWLSYFAVQLSLPICCLAAYHITISVYKEEAILASINIDLLLHSRWHSLMVLKILTRLVDSYHHHHTPDLVSIVDGRHTRYFKWRQYSK
ncbi:hypothetical protein GQ44DRAFT_700327 [Phaeosphaeriaceae sp. PMI808]|nr:hypothetical protein GQ44DRAFT_700327 [Phaeosphaeriaceae sp. PMI808]